MSYEKENTKLWGGRFDAPTSSIMERIGESISFDHRLYKQDIRGSIAHSKNLYRIGVLSERELNAILSGLEQIEKEIEENKLPFKPSLEDIHMHIESRLTELIGETGKKLHTARSRNDQVAQDVRLFLNDGMIQIQSEIYKLLQTLYFRAESCIEIIMPGYTHLQVAQPIRVSHYLLSYFWALYRDLEQFEFARTQNHVLVLGSGALAGVDYPTDRKFLAEELGIPKISENSIDSVSQRDHILNFLFASSQLMIHLSRFCEEIILFSSIEFSFVTLPDSLTTGSSIMPQKKNPDIAELIRGKSARVVSNLQHLLILLKGLPLSYNRDLQEDKIPLFDTLDQVLLSLEGMNRMASEMKFHPEKMQSSLANGFATATDLADSLVSLKHVPFREAHELTGRLVSLCVSKGYTLFTIPEELRREISPFFVGEDYASAISLSLSTDKKNVAGGTSRIKQLEQLEMAETKLKEWGKIQ